MRSHGECQEKICAKTNKFPYTFIVLFLKVGSRINVKEM